MGALLYRNGFFREALRWSLEAARNGNDDAAHNIAVHYQYGLGAEVDLTRAAFWYGEAATDGHEKAALALEGLRDDRKLTNVIVPLPIPKPESEGAPAFDRAMVELAQALLATLGYRPGPVDGRLGPRTRTAIEKFEQDFGFVVIGRVDDALLTNLRRVIVENSVTAISAFDP